MAFEKARRAKTEDLEINTTWPSVLYAWSIGDTPIPNGRLKDIKYSKGSVW